MLGKKGGRTPNVIMLAVQWCVMGLVSRIVAKLRDVFSRKDRYELITPQFEREDGKQPLPAPTKQEDYEDLKHCSDAQLELIGMRRWEDNVWLFPGEWYSEIPEGLEITNIADRKREFRREKEDDDIRFGCLSYGIEVYDDE